MDTSDDHDDDEEEEEPTDIASLYDQLAALQLRLNNMDERVAESEIERMELGSTPYARSFALRSNTLRRRPGTRISTGP